MVSEAGQMHSHTWQRAPRLTRRGNYGESDQGAEHRVAAAEVVVQHLLAQDDDECDGDDNVDRRRGEETERDTEEDDLEVLAA